MLDINSQEDYLMESLKNFKPPEGQMSDKSYISALEQTEPMGSLRDADAKVLAGVKMRDMVGDKSDRQELMQLENTNFVLDEEFRRTQQSHFDRQSEMLEKSVKEIIRHQNSFQTKTEVSDAGPVLG